jgi:hypothetical protein
VLPPPPAAPTRSVLSRSLVCALAFGFAVRLFSTVLSFPLSHLAKQRSCRVFASSFFLCFFLLHSETFPGYPVAVLLVLSFVTAVVVSVLLLLLLLFFFFFFFFVYLVVRSVIGLAIPTGGHATIYPTRRADVGSPRVGRTGPEDERTDGRSDTRAGGAERSRRYIGIHIAPARQRGIFKFRMGLVGHLTQGLERKSSSM